MSYSKADKQRRYNFDIFSEYEDVRLQKILHFIRIIIDREYYYKKKKDTECIFIINRIIRLVKLNESDDIEMERKVLYHLSKHIMLNDTKEEYNIKEVYLKEWL